MLCSSFPRNSLRARCRAGRNWTSAWIMLVISPPVPAMRSPASEVRMRSAPTALQLLERGASARLRGKKSTSL